MNEATVVEQNDENREENDFLELGTVSEETKGGVLGTWYDGGLGKWL